MVNDIASSSEAEIGTETVKTVLLTPARYKELLSTLESLHRENGRLRSGLEPFALMAGDYDGIPPSKYHGDIDFQLHYPSDTKVTLTIDYLRRARTALSSTGDTHGN